MIVDVHVHVSALTPEHGLMSKRLLRSLPFRYMKWRLGLTGEAPDTASPLLPIPALERGVTVIAAHCGTRSTFTEYGHVRDFMRARIEFIAACWGSQSPFGRILVGMGVILGNLFHSTTTNCFRRPANFCTLIALLWESVRCALPRIR